MWLRSRQPWWVATCGLSRWFPVSLIYRRTRPLRTPDATASGMPNLTPAQSTAALQAAAEWHFHTHPILARGMYRTTAFVERVVGAREPSNSSTSVDGHHRTQVSTTVQHRHRHVIRHDHAPFAISPERPQTVLVNRRPVVGNSDADSWPNAQARAIRPRIARPDYHDDIVRAPASRPTRLGPSHVVSWMSSPFEEPALACTQAPSRLIVHRLQRRIMSAAPAVVDEAEALLVVRQRAASLVWRRTRGTEDPNESTMQSSIRQASATPRTDRSNDSPSAAAMSSGRFAAAPPPAILKLDGPAIDRLAEDVMQRIDRRVRIERERRGL